MSTAPKKLSIQNFNFSIPSRLSLIFYFLKSLFLLNLSPARSLQVIGAISSANKSIQTINYTELKKKQVRIPLLHFRHSLRNPPFVFILIWIAVNLNFISIKNTSSIGSSIKQEEIICLIQKKFQKVFFIPYNFNLIQNFIFIIFLSFS
jgi:hypothetical protein